VQQVLADHSSQHFTHTTDYGASAIGRVHKHFQKACNRSDAPVDFSGLEEIEQRQTLDKLDEEPIMLNIIKAIKVMRSYAAWL
jgi:hypothetical protein